MATASKRVPSGRLSVTIRPLEYVPDATAKEAFWSAVRKHRPSEDVLRQPDIFERELTTTLPRQLAAYLYGRGACDRPPSDATPTPRFNIVFRIENIRYASLSFDLCVPDINALLDFVGNNVDVLEILLGQLLVPAFSDTFGLRDCAAYFDFTVSIPDDLARYAISRDSRGSEPTRESDRARALQFFARVVSSPLLVAILIGTLLWYYARQDLMEEKKLTHSLMQTVLQQQTETLRSMRAIPLPAQADERQGAAASLVHPTAQPQAERAK